MSKLLSRHMYTYVLVTLLLMGFNYSAGFAQGQHAYTIKGKITDGKGEGLPGVTVLVKGTSVGATSDPLGNYSINSPNANGVLVVSFIGYLAKEVPFNGANTQNVILTIDAKSLDEVVFVG